MVEIEGGTDIEKLQSILDRMQELEQELEKVSLGMPDNEEVEGVLANLSDSRYELEQFIDLCEEKEADEEEEPGFLPTE